MIQIHQLQFYITKVLVKLQYYFITLVKHNLWVTFTCIKMLMFQYERATQLIRKEYFLKINLQTKHKILYERMLNRYRKITNLINLMKKYNFNSQE